jgi:DNA repair and recombination protein RAD54B
VYRSILESSAFNRCLGSPDASLLLITILKKLCNSPGLLSSKDKEQSENAQALLSNVDPSVLSSKLPSTSGKLRVLDRLVTTLSSTTDEKIVIVSNYTTTLDMLQNLLSSRSLPFLRLDGSTPTDKRQELVDRFNNLPASKYFAFLLSAKSGGAGINLVGASRLVLFDLDWNPATDAQAMARIHRDGQKREVSIYRLLTTGCFDEKIFQRQITKRGLADSVMDNKSVGSAFTLAELRDLFSLDEATECQTHDLLGCTCEGRGHGDSPPPPPLPAAKTEEDSDEELDLMKLPGLVKASSVDEDMISGRNLKKSEMAGNLGALMEYEHVSTSRLAGVLQEEVDKEEEEEEREYRDAVIEDRVLMKVLREKGREKEVSFVFQKCS